MPTDRQEIRRRVNEYRADSNQFEGTDDDLGATKAGIKRDPNLRNVRVDTDEPKSDGEKLSMILSHLDSIHTALADTNARMDAIESRSRADGDEDEGEEGGEIDYGHKGAPEDINDDPAEPTPLVADRAKRDARDRRDAEASDLPIERSDSARRAAAEFQAKADRAFQAFSDAAPRFLAGETLTGYRQRLLSKLKKYSSAWANVNLYRLRDPEALTIAQNAILNDSAEWARSPASVPAGTVRAVPDVDQAGRQITRFYGNPDDVWGMFKQPTRRLVGINKNPNY